MYELWRRDVSATKLDDLVAAISNCLDDSPVPFSLTSLAEQALTDSEVRA